jgi:hypothetical protein
VTLASFRPPGTMPKQHRPERETRVQEPTGEAENDAKTTPPRARNTSTGAHGRGRKRCQNNTAGSDRPRQAQTGPDRPPCFLFILFRFFGLILRTEGRFVTLASFRPPGTMPKQHRPGRETRVQEPTGEVENEAKTTPPRARNTSTGAHGRGRKRAQTGADGPRQAHTGPDRPPCFSFISCRRFGLVLRTEGRFVTLASFRAPGPSRKESPGEGFKVFNAARTIPNQPALVQNNTNQLKPACEGGHTPPSCSPSTLT